MSPLPCPSCKHVNPAGSNFCNVCGGALPSLHCRRCGSLNDVSSAVFCNKCGIRLLAEDGTPDEAAPPRLTQAIAAPRSAIEAAFAVSATPEAANAGALAPQPAEAAPPDAGEGDTAPPEEAFSYAVNFDAAGHASLEVKPLADAVLGVVPEPAAAAPVAPTRPARRRRAIALAAGAAVAAVAASAVYLARKPADLRPEIALSGVAAGALSAPQASAATRSSTDALLADAPTAAGPLPASSAPDAGADVPDDGSPPAAAPAVVPVAAVQSAPALRHPAPLAPQKAHADATGVIDAAVSRRPAETTAPAAPRPCTASVAALGLCSPADSPTTSPRSN